MNQMKLYNKEIRKEQKGYKMINKEMEGDQKERDKTTEDKM